MRYFDASALVKKYVNEPGSRSVRRMLAADSAATSRLSEVEVASAVARRAREGSLTTEERDTILSALAEDMAALLVVEVTADIVALSRALLLRHPLRAGDAIQLASCLFLEERSGQVVSFVAFDKGLVTAARREGAGGRRRSHRATASRSRTKRHRAAT